MFCMVNDADVPKDRAGHLVVNGAGGVRKTKMVNGQEKVLQRFLSVLIPTNEHMAELPGEQDTLPYVGMLTALHLGQNEELYMESEDFSSAFNLFSVPDACMVPLLCILQEGRRHRIWSARSWKSQTGLEGDTNGMEVSSDDCPIRRQTYCL